MKPASEGRSRLRSVAKFVLPWAGVTIGVGVVGFLVLAFRWISAELGDPLIAAVGLALFLIVLVTTLRSPSSH